MMRLHVSQVGNEFSALYPSRKLSATGVEDYHAQARERDAATLAARVSKGMKLSAPLVFVPLPAPLPLGAAPGSAVAAILVGYLTDDAGALSAELTAAKPAPKASK